MDIKNTKPSEQSTSHQAQLGENQLSKEALQKLESLASLKKDPFADLWDWLDQQHGSEEQKGD